MIDVLIAWAVIAAVVLVAKKFIAPPGFKFVLIGAGVLGLVVLLAKLGVI